MNRNKVLVIDIDDSQTDGNSHIKISHAFRTGDKVKPVSEDYDTIGDMITLCEAICTLIHCAEKDNIKKSSDSLRDCINHLESGTFDASYFASTTTNKTKSATKG